MAHRPDCVHCRFMLQQATGEYHCRQHNISLHSPVSLFCKQIQPIESQDKVWFDESIDPSCLSSKTLYTWIETHLRDGKKSVAEFDSDELALISLYITWSAGTFWQRLRAVRQARRDSYRAQGHQIDE